NQGTGRQLTGADVITASGGLLSGQNAQLIELVDGIVGQIDDFSLGGVTVLMSDSRAEIIIGDADILAIGDAALGDGRVTIDADAISENVLATPALAAPGIKALPFQLPAVTYAQSSVTARALVGEGASITASGDVAVSADTDHSLSASTAINAGLKVKKKGTALKGKVRQPKGPVVTVTVADFDTLAEANVASSAAISGRNISVTSAAVNDFLASSKSKIIKPKANQGHAVGVTVTDLDVQALALFDGNATATPTPVDGEPAEGTGDVTVTASSRFVNNDHIAIASSKSKPAATDVEQRKAANKLKGKASPGALGISAGLVVADSDNLAEARIGAGSQVRADGDVTVDADAEDNFKQWVAGSSAAGAKVAIGGAIGIGAYGNHANALIADGARIEFVHGGALSVTADAIIPDQFEIDDDLAAFLDYEYTTPAIDADPLEQPAEYGQQLLDFVAATAEGELGRIGLVSDYLKVATILPNKVATSYVAASTSGGTEKKTSGAGKTKKDGALAVSASVNLVAIDNDATASLGEGVVVVDAGAVTVDAHASVDTIDLSGIKSVLSPISNKLNGKGGNVGATYAQMSRDNMARAFIDDGASVGTTGTLKVEATTFDRIINVAEQGGSGGAFGLNGAVTYNTLDNRSWAWIEDGASVDAAAVDLDARTDVIGIDVTGAITKGGKAGIGVSVSINDITNDTRAFIGDFEAGIATRSGERMQGTVLLDFTDAGSADTLTRDVGDWRAEGFEAGQLVTIDALGSVNSGTYQIDAISEDGRTLTFRDADFTTETAVEFGQVVSSGDAVLTFADGDTIARNQGDWRSDGFRAGQILSITGSVANDGSYVIADISADGLVLTLEPSASLVAEVTSGIEVRARDAALAMDERGLIAVTGDVDVDARTEAKVYAISIAATAPNGKDGTEEKGKSAPAGGKGTFGIGISGDVALNFLDDTTIAMISDGVTVTADGAVTLDAVNNGFLLNVGGALVINQAKNGLGIAGAFGLNDLQRDTQAVIDGATVTGASVGLDAKTTDRLISITAGASGAKQTATATISGSVNLNLMDTHTRAGILGGAIVEATDGDVVIDAATDVSAINVAGGVSIGGKAAVGAAADVGVLGLTTEALVGAGSEVDATGDVRLLAATDLFTVSVGGAIASGANLGVAGSGSSQTVDLTTRASIDAGARVFAGDSVLLDAADSYELYGIAGAVGNGKQAAIGVSLSNVNITRTVESVIRAGAQVGALANGDGLATVHDGFALDPGIVLDARAMDRIVLVAAGASNSNTAAIAGSATVSTMDSDVAAFVENGAKLNAGSDWDQADAAATQSVAISARHDSSFVTVAGAFSRGGNVAAGAAVDAEVLDRTVEAYIGQNAIVRAREDVVVDAELIENHVSVAIAGGASQNVTLTGSASVLTLTNVTRAYIDDNADVIAGDAVIVAATSAADFITVDGNIGYGGQGALGVSASTIVHDDRVEASIDAGARVSALAEGDGHAVPRTPDSQQTVHGVAVAAVSSEDFITISAGGQASGNIAIAGVATVNVLDERTRAWIGAGARINQAEAGSDRQSVDVRASDTTSVVSVAGAIGGGSTAGIGAGADVGVVTKLTDAWIADDAVVDAGAHVRVRAESDETSFSIAASLGAGQTVGVAGSASVLVSDVTTRAHIDGATVDADGSIQVSALATADVNLVAGNISAGGTASIGASAAVPVTNRVTESWVGADADLTARGLRGGLQAETGSFTFDTVAADSLEDFEFPEAEEADAPADPDSDQSGEGIDVDAFRALQGKQLGVPGEMEGDLDSDDTNEQIEASGRLSLTENRNSTASTSLVTGISVTAVNQDVVRSVAVSGGGSGTFALNASGGVAVRSATTRAFVGEDAILTAANGDDAGAPSVRVAAGDDHYHLGVVVAASIAGTVSVTPGADIAVLGSSTEAFVDDGASVTAEGDVAVTAETVIDVISVTAAPSGSGTVAVAGAAGVLVINTDTNAYIGDVSAADGGATVDAGGNVIVAANDETGTFMVTGSLAVGIGAAGIGAAAGVVVIDKDTDAFVGGASRISAAGEGGTVAVYTDLPEGGNPTRSGGFSGLAVQASSSEDLFTLAASGGVGLYAGVGGGVTVSVIDSDTDAFIGADARIGDGASPAGAGSVDGVAVAAVNELDAFTFAGGLGGGIAGIGGGVDVGIVRSDTRAWVESGAQIDAEDSVSVDALAARDIESLVVSAAGGGGAFAGSVSVWSIGSEFSNDYEVEQRDEEGKTLDPEKDSAFDMDTFGENLLEADSKSDEFSSMFEDYDTSTESGRRVNAAGSRLSVDTGAAGALSATGADAQSGTLAWIADGTLVVAENDISVEAVDDLKHVVTAGAVSLGAVAAGASIGILNVGQLTSAHVGGTLSAGAGSGDDLTVSARAHQFVDGTVFAASGGGSVGLGAQVLVFTDNSVQEAYIGTNADIRRAGGEVRVEASADREVTLVSAGGAVGLFGAAGVSVIVADIGGAVRAHIDDADVGVNGTVGDVTIDATSVTELDVDTIAVAGSLGVSLSGSVAVAASDTAVEAFLFDGAQVDIERDLEVSANSDVTASATAFGVSVGVFAAGVSVADTRITPSVRALVGAGLAGSQLTSGGSVRVNARSVKASAQHNQGAGGGATAEAEPSGGGLVGFNGGFATAVSEADTEASIGGAGTYIETTGRVEADADAANAAIARGFSVTVGVVGVGAIIGDADANGSTHARILGGSEVHAGEDAENGGSVFVTATGSSDARVEGKAAAGGVGSGTGVDSVATASPVVGAVIGDDAVITADAKVTVKAEGSSDAYARADGINAGGLTVGASLAEAISRPDIDATLGKGVDIVAGGLELSALQTVAEDGTGGITAIATAASGSLIGVNATVADTRVGGSVTASTGSDVSLTIGGELLISADNDTRQRSEVSGKQGAIVAVGANFANTHMNTLTIAALGEDANVIAGKLKVRAGGDSEAFAEAVSGSGGVISGTAAEANTDNRSSTLAAIGSGDDQSSIRVSQFDVTANHLTTFNGTVDSFNASVVGGSGAYADNQVDSTVQVLLGETLDVRAHDLFIDAVNRTSKPDLDGANLTSGSGGLFDLPATLSNTQVRNTTNIDIGDGTRLDTVRDTPFAEATTLTFVDTDGPDFDAAEL
ncbi:MAG TPA: hypothetical protein VLA56_12570, partial [Pseudomonadales bacterium]|nr:hypothetical protein [Pseudomonadales bacterium]